MTKDELLDRVTLISAEMLQGYQPPSRTIIVTKQETLPAVEKWRFMREFRPQNIGRS